jgi:hypothetical protein
MFLAMQDTVDNPTTPKVATMPEPPANRTEQAAALAR